MGKSGRKKGGTKRGKEEEEKGMLYSVKEKSMIHMIPSGGLQGSHQGHWSENPILRRKGR